MCKKSIMCVLIAALIITSGIFLLTNEETAEGGVTVTPTTIRIGLVRDVPELQFSVQGRYLLTNGYNGPVITMVEPGQRYTLQQINQESGATLIRVGVNNQQLGAFAGPLVLQSINQEVNILAGTGALAKKTGNHGLVVVNSSGQVTGLSRDMASYTVISADGVGNLRSSDELHLVTLINGNSAKRYRGNFDFRLTDDGITAINDVPFEEYLYGVVPSEMPASWLEEALKAQAVVARTYALYSRGQYLTYGFDILATQMNQVYHGYDHEQRTTTKAVNDTRGQVLTHQGRLILAVFHSSSGGYVGNCGEIWLQNIPYLKAKEDPYDFNDKHYNWSVTYNPQQLAAQFTSRNLPYTTVLNIEEVQRDETGKRVRSMHITGIGPDGQVKQEVVSNADRVRTSLGLKSSLFTMNKQYDSNNNLVSVTFNGSGWGHGVGMSQHGALGMAQKGYNYKDILQYYYTGVRLEYDYGV